MPCAAAAGRGRRRGAGSAPGRGRRVEDEVREAELDVRPDSLDLLVGVGGDDPALRRALRRQAVGEPLHLGGILDAHLLLGRQRECRPVAGVLERALRVGVEGHLHLDHALDGIRRAPGGGKARRDVREQRVAIELGRLAAGADEALGLLPRELRDHRARARDVDRHPPLRPVVDRRLLGAVVLTLEADALLRPQPADELHRLAQAGEPLARLGPLHARGGNLVQRLAGADAEDDAVREQAAEGREGLRDDRRVVAERRRQHARADGDARGARTERPHPRERERRVAAGVAPRLEMVADEHGIEAELLGEDRVAQQLGGTELLGRGLVAEPKQRAPPSMPAPPPRAAGRASCAAGAGGRQRRRSRASRRAPAPGR